MKVKSPLEQFDIFNVVSICTSTGDFSFNNIFIPLAFSIFIIFFVIFIYNQNFYLIPFYIQFIFEKVYLFVVNLVKQQAHNYGLF